MFEKLLKLIVLNLALAVVLITSSCTKTSAPEPPIPPINNDRCIVNGVDTCAIAITVRTATIKIESNKQTIHSFGASDCWGIKFVGKNWPVNKRNEIADLLFSKEVDASGNPKGIGLSLWRINVGAGSFEQGAASNITSEWRREECFQNASGTYDWSKQAGNRWFAQAAKARGVENLLLFAVAPPVHMSKNGLASGNPATSELGKFNLQADKYDDYADFLTEVAKNYTQAGMKIDFISPFNETSWNWVLGGNGQASQEGSAATNDEIFKLTKELDTKIVSKSLNSKITLCESGGHGYTAASVSGNTNRSDFINYFWNSNSPGFIGSLPSVEKVITSHSYFSQSNIPNLINYRTSLANRLFAVNNSVNYWQTEYCILDGEDGIAGPGRDLGINSALYIARVIHTDLAIGNAASWQWWLGVTPGDYKDGLVYIADQGGAMGELSSTKNDGIIYKSKMLWALGNYSRFIRPGMIRVDASLSGIADPIAAATSVMISAYKNPATKELVIVVLNMSSKDEFVKFDGLNLTSGSFKTYTTDTNKELQYSITPSTGNITVGAKSIVTFVSNYQ